ncbi:ABC transporter [Bacillus pseudomycoides]|uniref:peptidase domain-containing ABC transporter n=1 Tax=Bacillus pseudomycoides TaxID=64104 RepID=UPI000BF8AA7E|nr:peptidase domain-containing ABC transporter [Bacillus pseudomycoides]PFZ09484.1 ABC transporter [Bacillus pseudomycoides]
MKRKKRKKVPYVEQLQQTECGLCCVAMILRYYHSHETLHDLREYLDVGRDGASLAQLNQLMKRLNFQTKLYKAKLEGLYQLKVPAILFWGKNHFVVLEKIGTNSAYIVDPGLGRRRISLEELAEMYSSYVLVPSPNETFAPKQKSKSVWSYFYPVLLEKKLLFFQIALISIITYFATLSIPVLIEKIVDNAIENPPEKFVNMGIISILAGVLIYSLLTFLNGFQLIKMRTHIDTSINTNLISHLLKVPYKFFEIRSKADILFATNSSFMVRELFAQQLIKGFIDIGAIVVIMAYMSSKSLLLTIIASILFIANMLCILLFRPYLVETNQNVVSEQSKLQGTQVEIVYSMLGIKMSSIENDMFKLWRQRYQSYLKRFTTAEKFKVYSNTIIEFVKMISPLIILCTSLYLMIQGKMTIGELMSFYAISQTFFSLSSSLFNIWNSFVLTTTYLERMKDIITTKEEDDSNLNAKAIVSGDIVLNNVSFSYTKHSAKVIKNINLKINKGTKVAIVGQSGSGKSTLAKILIGLYLPTKGTVLYGNEDLTRINRKELRKKMGIVPQDVTLFNKTIFENIAMDRKDIDLNKVKLACQIAQIDSEIESMPMGYHTMISEMGMNLSGGQRQRIVMARAIVNEPQLLILDEATSSLDSINENRLANYFKQIGCTRIVIAHRLSTILDADQIIVLDKGEVIEQGTHHELLKNKGKYYSLYKLNNQVTDVAQEQNHVVELSLV